MDVVVVDAVDVGVRDDDVGEIAEGLDAVGEADRDKREGEVGGREESFFGERGAAVSGRVRPGVNGRGMERKMRVLLD